MKIPPRIVPSWDDYYMGLAYMVASRSKDPSTQIGAIVVDKNNKPLGIGYNGAPKDIPDCKINWVRPDKYIFIEHAEVNAMDHSSGSLEGATIYISAIPCPNCMRRLITKRIGKVIHGKTSVNMLPEEVIKQTTDMAEMVNLPLEPHKGNVKWLKERVSWLEENMPDIFN